MFVQYGVYMRGELGGKGRLLTQLNDVNDSQTES